MSTERKSGMRWMSAVLLFFLITPPTLAGAEVRVVTTLQILADIARTLGGSHVSVQGLAKGTEDPHYVIPRPSLMAAVSRADLFVELGLQFELWTERLLETAGNDGARPGRLGHVFAADGLGVLEVPERLTRAEGDIHPMGNPHIWLNPLNGVQMARNIADGLKRVDPTHAADYENNLKTFSAKVYSRMFGDELIRRFDAGILEEKLRQGELHSFLEAEKAADLIGGWLKQAQSLHGRKIVTYHREWSYLASAFGVDVRNTIEEKPGIPPSAAHRDRLLAQMKREGVSVIVLAPFEVNKIAARVASLSGARTVVIPANVQGGPGATDFFSLFDTILSELTAAFAAKG